MLKFFTVAVILSSILVGCGSASFFGGGKASTRTSTQTNPNNPNNPNGANTPNGLPVNPNGAPNGSTPPGVNGWTPGQGQIIPSTDPDLWIQPNPNQIIFAPVPPGQTQPRKFFHIGNNKFSSQSNCAQNISQFNVAGVRYYFEFITTKPNTILKVAKARAVCGIDNQTSNWGSMAFVNMAGSQIAGVNLILQPFLLNRSMNNTEIKIATEMPLSNAGRHVIFFDSVPNAKNSGATMENGMLIAEGDPDDYLIGDVFLEASEPISPGNVGAL